MTMRHNILRSNAKAPHTNINILDVIGQNPFSAAINLVCVFTQLKILQVIDKMKALSGCIPKVSCSNMVSNPPVVGVSVLASNRIKT